MKQFTKHNLDTTPEASAASLQGASQAFGFIPNLLAYMAESSFLLDGYMHLFKQIEHTDLTPLERQVVMMTLNRYHECRYCMAGHTQMSEMQGLDMAVINAIRDDEPLEDPKLAALRAFTLKMAEQRGVVSQTLIDAFYKAGYSQQNALEVIASIAMKVMSNYTNHLVGTEIDGASMSKRWSPISER
jgi:alkylhydroperoxidase family enzyme